MDIFVPKFIEYQLYLLQLENYELGRYWKLLFKKGFWPRGKQRKELVWSTKAKALMVMAWALHALVIVLAGLAILSLKPGTDNFFTAIILAALIFLPFYFILFSLALLALKPLDSLAKKNLVMKAKSKIENLTKPSPPPRLASGEAGRPSPIRRRQGYGGQEGRGGLMVIGVAGSYGKTTMKEVLKQVLDIRYKVLATPESVNTPVGIARWILNKVTDDTQVLIVEMGEHYQGDIKEICDIASPDIAVVTGINESHLERMGKMETVIATIFEIVSNSKQGAAILLNADDVRVMENYKKFVWPDQKIEKFQILNFKFQKFDTDRLGWHIPFCVIASAAEAISSQEKIASSPDKALAPRNDTDDINVFINLLGEYALGDVDAVIKIAKNLGMENQEIIDGIKNIKPVEHRLQPIKSAGDVLVIDDAYNGNPDGVREAVKVLSRFTGRRKVYITPGLVEMGNSSEEVHRQIGRELAGVADVVILIKNSVTGFIEEGINTTPPRATSAPLLFKEGDTAVAVSPPGTGGVPREAGGGGRFKILWFNTAPEAHAGLKNILKPGDVVMFQNDWGDQYL